MRPFDFHLPTTLVEALDMLERYKESVHVIAGGTDLVLELNEKKAQPDHIIDLTHIPELKYIRVKDGVMHIGAMATHAQVAADETVKEKVRILYDACRQVGSPQIRNLATLGGNICQSSVAGDGLAACVTLDADVTIVSKARGERTIKLDKFLAGEGVDKKNILLGDELMTEVSFRIPETGTATAFYKLGRRRAMAIAVIGGGAVIRVDKDGVCTYARLRAGALGRYPMELKSSEEHLVGKKLNYATMLETLPLMHDQVLEANKSRPWSVFYKKESVQGVYKHVYAMILHDLGIEEVQE